MLAHRTPGIELVTVDAHPLEEQLEVELRMGLEVALAPARGIGRVRAEHVPFGIGDGDGEIGEDDHALGQPGDDALEPGDGRGAGGDAGGADEAGRGRGSPALRHLVDQQAAAIGEIDAAEPGEFPGPAFEDDLEEVERAFPMGGELGAEVELLEAARRDLLDQQLVERGGEVAGKADGFGGVVAGLGLLDQPGEDELALERADCGGDGFGIPRRIEHRLVELGVADRDEAREEKAAAAGADEGVLDGALGTVVGEQDDAAGERHRIGAEALDQPVGQRIREGAVRGDGVEVEGFGHGLGSGLAVIVIPAKAGISGGRRFPREIRHPGEGRDPSHAEAANTTVVSCG